MLVPNETEARVLLNGRDLPTNELAQALAAGLGVPTVVVTLGASGCVIHAAGVTHQYPAPTTEAVNPTGASDAFTATFAAHITAGASEPDAIEAAQSAAAWAIRRHGGHESMPSSS